jgi:uncharacterized protein
MLILLSPSKTMDFSDFQWDGQIQMPTFIDKATQLVSLIREMELDEIKTMMNVSPKLAFQTKERFLQWIPEHPIEQSLACIFAFSGDVFSGLGAREMSYNDILVANETLCILSGLYGVLHPLDKIMPFRLELGINWQTPHFKNLYEYWKQTINEHIINLLQKQEHPVIINLASQEYFKIIDKKNMNAGIIEPVFMEWKTGTLKTVSIYAKRARGLMSRFIIQNHISNPEDLQSFDSEGYAYHPRESTENKWVFAR